MYRILVVANETLEGAHLVEEVRRKVDAAGESAVHLVVPASHGRGAWTEGGARSAAQARLDDALITFKELGAEVTGEVGDPSPVLAVSDAMIADHYDEIVFSTLPAGVSRWLKQDAPSRIQRNHPSIPLTHVTSSHLTG
jgi:hypothetical protein